MLSAYALGALEAEETRELEAYVAAHEDLRAELDVWSETTAMLAFAAPAAEPSPKARDNILTSVRALKASKSLDQEKEQITALKEKAQAQQSNIIPFPVAQMKKSWNAIQIITALAASVVIAFLAFLVWSYSDSDKKRQNEIADLKNRMDQAQKQLEQEREFKKLFESPETNIVTLKGTEAAPNAQAHFAYNRSMGKAYLTASNLPPVPAGKAYQIWFIEAGKPPVPGKTFRPDADGRAELRDQIPQQGLNASVFAVTVENEQGATTPTLPIQMKS